MCCVVLFVRSAFRRDPPSIFCLLDKEGLTSREIKESLKFPIHICIYGLLGSVLGGLIYRDFLRHRIQSLDFHNLGAYLLHFPNSSSGNSQLARDPELLYLTVFLDLIEKV